MSRRALLVVAVFLAFVPVSPAAAKPAFGEAVALPFDAGSLGIRAYTSSAEHGIAMAMVDHGVDRAHHRPVVVHQDARGRWRRFALPPTSPEAIRFALLENGGGLVAWDDAAAGTVSVRTWRRDGSLSPVQVVLSGIRAVWSGDFDVAAWKMASDRRGTVVIAAPAAGARHDAVDVAVREPGGGFGPPQELAPPPGADPTSQRALAVGPVSPDGGVRVTWDVLDPRRSDATGGTSRARPGHGASFGPAEPPPPADPSLAYADGSVPVRLATDVQRLCMHGACSALSAFGWRGRATTLAFWADGPRAGWYVASRQADGRFARPVLATKVGAPVQLARRGQLAFLRYGHAPRLRTRPYLVPYGEVSDQRRATVALGPFAGRKGERGAVELNASCNEPCRLIAAVQVVRRGRAGARRISAVRSAPDPVVPVDLVVRGVPPTPAGSSLRVTLTAIDRAGRRTVSVFRMTRGDGTALRRTFCVVQIASLSPSCR